MPIPNPTSLLHAYRARVRRAANLLKAGKTDCREFDNCFEMHDGDLVVTALVRQAHADPDLAAAIHSKFDDCWRETVAKYADMPDAELAYEARRHIWKAWGEWELQTVKNRPDLCTVCEVVFDYGGSIPFACDLDLIDTAIRIQRLGVKFNNIIYRSKRLTESAGIVLTATGVVVFLRAFVADTGGKVIGHELTKGQIAAGKTFNREVDEQIRRVKKALPKHTGHPLYKAVVDMASTLLDL